MMARFALSLFPLVCFFLFFTVSLAFEASSSSSSPCFRVPEVSFDELLLSSASRNENGSVGRALAKEGIVAITGLPGYAAIRGETLASVAERLLKNQRGVGVSSVFGDGSLRRTVASETKQGRAVPFVEAALKERKGAEEAKIKVLARVDSAAAALRASVRRVSELVCASIDAPLSKSLGEAAKEPNTLLSDMFAKGRQLEHFHAYRPSGAASPAKEETTDAWTLKLHTDNGFLISFVPAAHFRSSRLSEADEVAPPASEFVIKLRDGSVRCADFPRDSVVIMLGEGAEAHFAQLGAKHHPLTGARAVPHGVKSLESILGSAGEDDYFVRAWFGNMFLLPDDYPLRNAGSVDVTTTYKSVRGGVVDAFASSEERDPIGCLGSRIGGNKQAAKRALNDPSGSCPAGEIYCWLTCADVSSLSCTGDETPTCVDTTDNSRWVPADGHCKTCVTKCMPKSTPAPSTPAPADEDQPFCNGIPSSMHMDGFVLDGNAAKPCTLLFFPGWTINSRVKMAFSSLGIILLGVATEWCVYMRRTYSEQHQAAKATTVDKLVRSVMYGVNVFLGYMLMLAAMTYSVSIFVMVILGLTIGHGIFNANAAVGETTDPCCSGQNDCRARSMDSRGRSLSNTYQAPAFVVEGGEEQHLLFKVKGMTCMEGCGSTVQKAVTSLPGVRLANISIENGTADVWGVDLNSAKIEECVASVGFNAAVQAPSEVFNA